MTQDTSTASQISEPSTLAARAPANPLIDAADSAVRAIPPMFPLSATVAVNPYVGQAGLNLADTGNVLTKVGAGPVTMPRPWFSKKLADGEITTGALEASIAVAAPLSPSISVGEVEMAARSDGPKREALPTIVDLVSDETGTDWKSIIDDRFGLWAGGYFDEGQALWAANKDRDAYTAWRETATHDLTPEMMGLSGFARFVADAPRSAEDALKQSVEALGLTDAMLLVYFHRLLVSLGGWAQLARLRLWNAELAGGADRTTLDLLAIRLLWEEALFLRNRESVSKIWDAAKAGYAEPLETDRDLQIDMILQEALERSQQDKLARSLAERPLRAKANRPAMQAAFCIDVRSEVFRRALEAQDPSIETIGFAGFFGLSVEHKSFASDTPELRHPVLIGSQIRSKSGGEKDLPDDQNMRFLKRAKRAWGRFKLAAVSSFAFVEATGPLYVIKLVRDALGLAPKPAAVDPAPRLDGRISFEQQVDAAETILKAMSLTSGFAKLVAIIGHGAAATNNAHLSALQCGACGGHSGEVNARLLALLLNNQDVRKSLVQRGIEIPADTVFVAGLHNTTADTVALYDADGGASKAADLDRAKRWLAAAGAMARTERLVRLPNAESQEDIAKRTLNWGETRPEWGLAGCSAFIAAPRNRTVGADLGGRAFLHDYRWQDDDGFGILELIMTAPVVVASWISLQYYGSTVAPEQFGSGDKLLHNVVGGVGVFEGNGGVLRSGLAHQSVHDGEGLAHEPRRLTVCIEAPQEAILDILNKHPQVRALFDNRWLHLFVMDEQGAMAWRYAGDLAFEAFSPAEEIKKAA
ncbi:MAG: DUF2309 domain-containing protein [Pseudomonadota bacterium]